MKSLIKNIQQKLPKCKIAMSLAPYQISQIGSTMNQKIKLVNASLELEYSNHSVVKTYPNLNVIPTNECLARDGIHLNRRGSSILASNIRYMINSFLSGQVHPDKF